MSQYTNTDFPQSVDVFVDPDKDSPTAFGSPTDHAAAHAKTQDAVSILETLLLGTVQGVNRANGVAKTSPLGALTVPGLWLNTTISAYGSGYLLDPNAGSSQGADVLSITETRLGLLGATTYARNGTRLLDVFYDLLGVLAGSVPGAGWPGVGNRSGIVLIDCEHNDFYNAQDGSGSFGVLSTLAVTNYQDTLKACIALIQSASRAESNNGTQTGSAWTSPAGNWSNGDCLSTTNQGDQVTYPPVVVPANGTLWHLGYYTTSATGQTTLSIGAQTVGTAPAFATAGADNIFSLRSGSINRPSSFIPVITPITGLTPGQTVQVSASKTDSTSNPIYTDAILVPANSYPLIVVVKDPLGRLTNPVPTSPPSTLNAQIASGSVNKGPLDIVIDAVAGASVNVLSLNLAAALNPGDLSYVDGFSLNDRGMRKFSDLLCYAIGFWAASHDSDALYQTL